MNNSEEAIVNTKNGKLEGFSRNGLHIFKGIPYATPPVGELRWMPPRPVESRSGVRQAKEYGAIAPQNLMPPGPTGAPSFEGQPQSEDCLFLNIWTPGLDDARRPVLFWIHGLDNPFLFGSLDDEFTGSDPEPEDLVIKIQDSCAAFARTGDPSCETAGQWPAYDTDRMTMLFGRNSRVEAAPYETERAAWDHYDYLVNPPI